MTEPPRFLQTGNPEARAALQDAKSWQPEPAQHAALLVALGPTTGTLVAGSAAATATTSAAGQALGLGGKLALLGWKTWVVGALLVTSAGAGTQAVRRQLATTRVTSKLVAQPPKSSGQVAPPRVVDHAGPTQGDAVAVSSAPPTAFPAMAASAVGLAVSPVATLPHGLNSGSAPSSGTSAGAGDASDASDEFALMARCRREVIAGQGAAGLRSLDEYERRFPSGQLLLEAKVLRIQALAASGRKAEAREAARVFIARYPRSALAHRLRQLAELDGSQGPGNSGR